MTQEDKKLLLTDLSARLPYRVLMQVQHCKVECRHHLLGVNTENNTIRIDHCNEFNEELFIRNWMPINDCRPYLRPMSSMTDDEKKEFYEISGLNYYDGLFTCKKLAKRQSFIGEILDWLNAHHFDYRGLIEKGLALEATEGMYN